MCVDLNIFEIYKLRFIVDKKLEYYKKSLETFTDSDMRDIIIRELYEYEDILKRIDSALEQP